MSQYGHLPEAARRMAEHSKELAEYTSTITVTLESNDGLVEVTVGHGGAVRNVRIHRDAYRELTPAKLGAAITKTCEHATAQLSKKVSGAYAAAFGADVDPLKVARGEIDLREAMAVAKEKYGLG